MASSITRRAPRWRRFGLLLALLLAVTVVPALAQDEPPAEPLLPNIEPVAGAELQASLSEEEAVLAALADYTTNAEAAAALADLPPESLLFPVRLTFLPLVSAGRSQQIPPVQNPTPTPEPEPRTSADVAVTVRARPSILVRPGEQIIYTFTLRNLGDGDARETKVIVPYDRHAVTPIYTSLDSGKGDWLSELSADRYVITFGRLAEGAARSGQVVVRAHSWLPVRPSDPVVISTRANYTWRDGADGGEWRSNWAPVVVGGGSVHGDFVWVRVSPDRGPIGTTHTFYSNRFLPGERVSAWVNVHRGAGGVRALNLTGTANSLGVVELRLRSTDPNPDLPRGTHQIVLAGQRSGLQGVVDFTVE